MESLLTHFKALTPEQQQEFLTVNKIPLKKQSITEKEINTTNLTKSKILECIINKQNGEIISTGKKYYRSIMTDIWNSMSLQMILQNTTMNIKFTNEKGEKGYNWYPPINISFQNKDAKNTLKEIIKMVTVCLLYTSPSPRD